MVPRLKPLNQIKGSSKKTTPQQSLHDIFQPDFTNLNTSKDLEKISEQSSFNLEDNKQPDQKLQNKAETLQKVLTRLGLQKIQKYKTHDQQLQLVIGNVIENCIGTIDEQTNVLTYQKNFNNQYKQAIKNKAQRSSIIVNEINEIQKIQLLDKQGLIGIYRQGRLFLKKLSRFCQTIIELNLFESFILLIILLNSIKMALDDPLITQDNDQTIQSAFIVIYTSEMVLKIFAYGLFFNERAYLRDLWNILDFVIVITSLLPYVITIQFSVNSLRAIRVLRPLKTITKIKALKMIVSTLFYSFSLVMDSLYILIFVIIVFAIAGTQLFSGVLKNRCLDLATGNLSNIMCVNGNICSDGTSICAKGLTNPNFSINNFDTFLWSMLNVFQTITLEGWSLLMVQLQACYSIVAAIYSILIIFFCQYVILNMTMAILKYKYSQTKGNKIEEQQGEQTDYQPEFLKKLGIFKDITNISLEPPLQRYYVTDKIFVGSIQFNKNLDNQFNRCMQTKFEVPPDTSKTLGRIKTVNLQKSKKFDLSKIARGAKIDQYKWDAKTLQFQSIQLAPKTQKQQLKNIQLQNQQNNKAYDDQIIQDEQQNDIEEYSHDEYSDDSSNKQIQKINEFDEKIYQMQMKLGQSRSNAVQITKSSKVITFNDKKNKKPFQFEASNLEKQTYKIRPQMKQMNQALNIVREAKTLGKAEQNKNSSKLNISNIIIPQINFKNYKVQNLYQKFNDLGQFRIKRVQKQNQLNYFNVKPFKKYLKNVIMEQKNILKQISQQNSLDIKQLQLINELIKKKMKCRIKSKQQLNQQQQYDKSRILVFQARKQETKKIQQLQENMRNLNFVVNYKTNYQNQTISIQQSLTQLHRNYEPQTKGLRITQFMKNKQQKQKPKIGSSRHLLSKTMNYMKMLHNHKMQQKIQFQQDRIMAMFFKKDQEQKNTNGNKNQIQFKQIQQSDIFKKHGHIKLTCPIDVSQQCQSQFLSSINIKDQQYEIYMKGILGFFTVLRKKTVLFINKPFYDNLMLLFVLANTVILALNGLVDTSVQPFTTINETFTILFSIDLGLKIFAFGFDFFSDIMGIFDSFVVCISVVELAIGSGGNLSALRSIRILRAFRVLRVTRLIRSLSYMKIVMSVVSSVITQFIYIFMLLALFIFIYTLLGMQILGGELLPESVTGIRQNFDTFFNAVFAVFQVLTVQNWNDIQTAVMASSSTMYFGIIYLISWIFIGNWILLNLLQAILLDGFDKDSSPQIQQKQEQEQDQNQEQQLPLPPQQQNNSQSQSKTTQVSIKQNFKPKDTSLLLFYPTSWPRVIASTISTSQIFKNFMLLAIALSSIKLVMDTYITSGTAIDDISKKLDLAFNAIFIFECLLKIITNGLLLGQNAYLKDSWSKLDFFIVLTAIVDMTVSVDLSILKLFRILRPLRIISRNLQMRIIITSLAQSMCGIMNVMIIILFVFIMFGILGINLLQDKLNYCSFSSQLSAGSYGPFNINQDNCLSEGGVWTTQFINFDNILNSLLSLYVFSTRQNWPYYVYSFIDSTDQGPVKDNNQLLYFVFAVVFIFVCSYFFMDLLVGVLFMNFHQAQLKIKPKVLTDKQTNWLNLQKIIIQEDPCFDLYLQPEHPFRKFFHKIVTWKPFQLGITVCILFNIVTMIINEDDQSADKQTILNNMNFGFSIIFIMEMLLKLIAFNKAYFLSGWNIFDFFVVMASILDIILGYTGARTSQSSALSILPQIARIFRVLRITRLLRMFKRFKGLQKLIQTFIFSLPALGRGLSIVCLFMFISSILASYLFSNISKDYSGSFTQYLNYQNFHSAIQTLFVNTTGQNWYFYMYKTILPGYIQCVQGTTCVQAAYLLFWLIYIFFSQKVFMQLFVLIVLDQFQSNYIHENNPLGIFALFQDDFRTNWIEITTKYKSIKIQTKRLLDLLLVLKQPLGLGKKQLMSKYEQQLRQNEKLTEEQIQQSLKQLDIKLKKNGAKLIQKMDIIKNRLYLSYHQTFYRFAKIALISQCSEKATNQQKKLLDQIHKTSQQKLQQLIPKEINYEFQQDEDNLNTQPLNPIMLILMSQMIVKSWYNYSLKYHAQRQTRKNQNQNKDSLNNSCSSQVQVAQLQKLPIQRNMEKRRGMLQVGNNLQENKYQFKAMPNIEDHYQIEKKKNNKKIINSVNAKLSRRSRISFLNIRNLLTHNLDKKSQADDN